LTSRETDKIMPDGSSETVIERSDASATAGTAASGRGGNARQVAENPAAAAPQGTTVVKRSTFREAASVIINAENGLVVVRATSRQHEKVQEFLNHVTASARRQVLIEATIAEVRLSRQYRQGINWQSLRSQRSGGSHSAGFQMSQKPTGTVNGIVPDPLTGTPTAGPAFLLDYVAPGLGISATISLLETFGDVRVLSSPKIGVLNNQTALLKVVNNTIYFDIKADTTTSSTGLATTTVTTTPRSVSVGLVMTVTPQISEAGVILLNVRPSISRISGIKNDPNPNIPAGLVNAVPEIETREMESVLRLNNGEIAVMGGLMQDAIDNTTNAVPGLADIPLIGNFFKQRDETSTKTELVVFLRPLVIRDPSIRGDFLAFRDRLPGGNVFDGDQKDEKAGRAAQ
jgi:general secretion pathway protein D